MKTSGKHLPPGLTFAAGAFVGAIGVFVPLSSAGHAGSIVDGSGRRSPGAVRPSAGAKGPKFYWWMGDDPRLRAKTRNSSSEGQNEAVNADTASSTKQDTGETKQANNEATCDVQLD